MNGPRQQGHSCMLLISFPPPAAAARCVLLLLFQGMLRHRTTKQPPHPALIQQLLTYHRISTRGVYQWQQHVLAALTDAQLAAAAAATQLSTAQQQQQVAMAAAGSDAAASGGSNGPVTKGESTAAAPARVPGDSDATADGGDLPVTPSTSCWGVLQQLACRFDPVAAAASRAQLEVSTGCCSTAMLEYLPALVVLQPGDMYCYICADLLAAALWGRFLDKDPLDPAAWEVLRRGLFEAGSGVPAQDVVQGLLGPGSMQQTSVQLGLKGQVATGWVPNLEHPCFHDVDLWG